MRTPPADHGLALATRMRSHEEGTYSRTFSEDFSGGSAAQLSSIAQLLARMRDGDREAAADFVTRYGDRIRRRVRGKLGSSMRRLFDSLEILSTLGRRLDLYVMDGRLRATSEAQLWALVFQMADNALVDKTRLFMHLQSVEGEDGTFANLFSNRLHQAEQEQGGGVDVEVEQCIQMLDCAVDRRILALWLAGEPHTQIAHQVDLAPTAVRKRWESIKHRLRERLVAR
jgi:DNA-directed RNA polymerase specialized sigma24 family protein